MKTTPLDRGNDNTREALERSIGYQFKDPAWLETALTHSSFGYEHGVDCNERLEFLGDSVLGFLVAKKLFVAHPGLREGDLSKLKSALVSTPTLASQAQRLGLGEAVRFGVGERRTGGKSKASILAATFESVVAAIFMDGGLEAASALIDRCLGEGIQQADLARREVRDFKTELQEKLQAMGHPPPSYEVVTEAGPDHRREFVVRAVIGDRPGPEGRGRSKKAAQQVCASRLLEDKDFWDNLVALHSGTTLEETTWKNDCRK